LEQQESTKQQDWMTIYRNNSIEAHKLRQANDHIGAKKLFEQALEVIEEEMQKGNDDERLLWNGATLNYAILDCMILLQSTPSDVMNNLHKYGDLLKEMMLDFSRTDPKLRGIEGIFDDGFTATDIDQLKYAVERFDDIVSRIKEEELTNEQNEKLSMFYFFLSNYFHTTQLFFGFSTKMVQEGVKSKDMFKDTSKKTIELFDKVENQDFDKYKSFVKKWFSIYSDIMEATYALYVEDKVFESNWEFQEKDVDMLWEVIETSLAEESDDEAANQTNQNAAAQAMELLLDVYSTYALMNVENYEKGLKGLSRISEKTEELKQGGKVTFYNHLKRAIIARKYLLEMRFNEQVMLPQFNPVSFFGSRRRGSLELSAVSGIQYDLSNPNFEGLISHVDPFDAKTTEALQGVADKPAALSLPDETDLDIYSRVRDDMPTNVYEQSEQQLKNLRKDKKYMKWEETFLDQLSLDIELAKMYIPEEIEQTNHLSNKWLAILEARMLLYSHFHSKENLNADDTVDDIASAILDVIDDSRPLAKLSRIEELLLKHTETPKGAYFRQLVEIYVILGWVYVEKIDLFREALIKENDIDVNKEPFIYFDKARDYLCKAFNILQDMGDESITLQSEIRRAYAKLKFLNISISESEDEDDNKVLPSIDKEANMFRRGQWNKAFCDLLRHENLGEAKEYKKTLLQEFEKMIKDFVPHVVSVKIFKDNSGIKTGKFTKNDYATGGMYKTVIKVPQADDRVLGIQSELPMPSDVVNLIAEFTGHIFTLNQIYNLKTKRKNSELDRIIKELTHKIFHKTAGIVDKLVSDRQKQENQRMRSMFYSKLVEMFNLKQHKNEVDKYYADYIARFYDIGMAGIDSYFFEKPENELLPFEKQKKQEHTQIGFEILRGILGDDFDDVLIMALLHHEDSRNLEVSGLSEEMTEILNILRISDMLREFTAAHEVVRVNDIKTEDEIKSFLSELSEKEFSSKFIEFVQESLYPSEEADLFMEV
jgi:phosphoribosyl-ATP pyrophosphohydrolase